jgi:hypothetical protein
MKVGRRAKIMGRIKIIGQDFFLRKAKEEGEESEEEEEDLFVFNEDD